MGIAALTGGERRRPHNEEDDRRQQTLSTDDLSQTQKNHVWKYAVSVFTDSYDNCFAPDTDQNIIGSMRVLEWRWNSPRNNH